MAWVLNQANYWSFPHRKISRDVSPSCVRSSPTDDRIRGPRGSVIPAGSRDILLGILLLIICGLGTLAFTLIRDMDSLNSSKLWKGNNCKKRQQPKHFFSTTNICQFYMESFVICFLSTSNLRTLVDWRRTTRSPMFIFSINQNITLEKSTESWHNI